MQKARKKPGPKVTVRSQNDTFWGISRFPSDLIRRLRIAAALEDMKLREFVIEKLEHAVTGVK